MKRETLSYLVLAKDPGSATCLSPVIDGLLKKNKRLFIFAKDRASEIFRKRFAKELMITESQLQKIISPRVTVILTSGTSDPNFEGSIIKSIKQKNPRVKLVSIENFPGSLIGLTQKLAGFEDPISPDLVFVTSRSTNKKMCQILPHLGKDKIITVCQPEFDLLLSEQTQVINRRVRKRIRINHNDLLVSYFGALSREHPDATHALAKTISALNAITNKRNIYLAFRPHPREINSSLFDPILKTASEKVKIINPSEHQQISTREISAAANLIVTTISTPGLETALRGSRPQTKIEQTGWLPLHIMLPPAQAWIKKNAGSLPVVELGATATALASNEIQPVIEKALFDKDFQRQILKAQQGPLKSEYRFYGRKTSTDRVLLRLERFEKTLN